RFFSMFSHIETLVIDGSPYYLEGAMETMGVIHVKRLQIWYSLTNEGRAIVNLVRKHQIKHVSIEAFFFLTNHFGEYVSHIERVEATLDIYGRDFSDIRKMKIFRRSYEFWQNQADQLREEGISMNISRAQDENFDESLEENSIRTHLRMRKFGDVSIDKPITQQRGYK
ncbi:hypothetical protein PMAYCL1PPCAC_08153, partial [Pristionchus mayeri]